MGLFYCKSSVVESEREVILFFFYRKLPQLTLSNMGCREGCKKKLVEFSTKVGGWGRQWTDFPLIHIFG